MKLFLKILLGIATLIVITGVPYFAWTQYRASRERLAMEEIKTAKEREKERVRLSEAKAQQAENGRRASALVPAPHYPPKNRSLAKNGRLHSLSFSPDGKFLAATVDYETVGELAVWPSTGGPTLARMKFDYRTGLRARWVNRDTLNVDGDRLRLHKGRGYWELQRVGSFSAGGNGSDIRRDNLRLFYEQDLRLQVEPGPPPRGLLRAYSLATGVRLPLPTALERQGDLEGLQPLARWGKYPLRLARLKSIEVDSKQGLRSRSELELWDARAKKCLWKKVFPDEIGGIFPIAGGKSIVAIGIPRPTKSNPAYSKGGIALFDSTTGKILAQQYEKDVTTYQAAASPEGKWIALDASKREPLTKKTIRYLSVYKVPSLQRMKIITLNEAPKHLVFSPDNKYVIASTTTSIRFYDWRLADSRGKAPYKEAWL